MASALRAQERSLALTQGWFGGLFQSLKEQAETYAGLLRALESSLNAVEKALNSQTEANRALKESFDASRSAIVDAVAAQERNITLAKSLSAGMLESVTAQLEVLRAQVRGGQALFTGPLEAQSEPFQRMAQNWLDAYDRLLETSLSYFQPGGSRSRADTSE